jgi:hypothetical protein
MRQFEIMPRDPNAKGLNFQSSIYEPVDGGRAHNLICEVYLTEEAEHIKRCLNSHADLLEACIAAWDVLNEFCGASYDVGGEQEKCRAAIVKAGGKTP